MKTAFDLFVVVFIVSFSAACYNRIIGVAVLWHFRISYANTRTSSSYSYLITFHLSSWECRLFRGETMQQLTR